MLAAIVAMAPLSALAPPGLGDLETHADDVTIDTERRELVLRGHVSVEASPFHLRSEALRLRRTGRGIEVDGEGKLAFCPCLGTPLTLSFESALVGPPSDLILEKPRLEIYGVPVLWLPYFWLRAPDRPGLLPPEIAYRGRDGMFVGAGVHLPWARLDPNVKRDPSEVQRIRDLGFDVRSGAYLKGGYAIEGDLRTPRTRTKVRFDWLDSGGLSVDARGSEGTSRGAAWDVSAMRGRRALESTLSLDEAARPLDRARAETFVREGPVTVAGGAVVTAARGAAAEHGFGPVAHVSVSEALGAIGRVSASARGGAFREPLHESSAFTAAEVQLVTRGALGIVGATFDTRGEIAGVSGDRAARLASSHSTLAFGLPLVRAFASEDSADPWRHRLEPKIAGNVLAVSTLGTDSAEATRGLVPVFLPLAPSGAGVVALPEARLESALGRYGARDGLEVDLAAGYAAGAANAPVARARIAASGEHVGASVEGGGRAIDGEGIAASARVRVGSLEELHVEGRAGGREGIDPTLARLLSPALREAPTAYFAGEGFSAGGTLVVPITRNLTTRGGADFDLATGSLLGARGSVDLRDGCGCVTLRTFGSHRLGREGVDVWLALELGEPAPKH